MKDLRAWGRTLRQIWRDPKNRRDGADYVRAAAIIALTAMAAVGGAYLILGAGSP